MANPNAWKNIYQRMGTKIKRLLILAGDVSF